MKKGRHRRYEEARRAKRSSEVVVQRCAECGAGPEEDHASWCLAEAELEEAELEEAWLEEAPPNPAWGQAEPAPSSDLPPAGAHAPMPKPVPDLQPASRVAPDPATQPGPAESR